MVDVELLKGAQIVIQIILTVGGAIFAIKRALTDPINRRLDGLYELQKANTEELREYIAKEIERLAKENEALRKDMEKLRSEVDIIQKEYVTKDIHFRDISGWRGEINRLSDKLDSMYRWFAEKLLEVRA